MSYHYPSYSPYQAPGYNYPGDTGIQAPQIKTEKPPMRAWFDFNDYTYLKGFFLGAALAVIINNPDIQKTVIKGGVKIWSTFQGGLEELKEQVKDVRAEMSQG